MKNEDEADGDKQCNCSCGSLFSESDKSEEEENIIGDTCKERLYTWMNENGILLSRKLTEYECNLEDDVQKLQDALFSISSHYAKIQFRLRQITCASGNERLCLLRELQRITCQGIDASRDNDELPTLMSDAYNMGDVRVRQQRIISQLRSRLTDLSKITDSGFCVESESSYNLRKYERADDTPSCEITSDGTVQHGRYCACIICKEEFAKIPASERGFLAETWPMPQTSEDEYSQCKVDGESKSKSKKKQHKRKSKKSDKLSSRRFSRHGSLNRYYSMSFEGKSPSTRSRQDTLRETPSGVKSLLSKATFVIAAGARKSASQRLQRPSVISSLSRGTTSNRRIQSETGFKRSSQSSNRAPSVGKSLSFRSSNQRSPQGSLNRIASVAKSSSQRIQQASPNGSSILDKSPSQRSTKATIKSTSSTGKCQNKCVRKGSQQDSFTSSYSDGKRLGPKTPLLSITGKTQNPDGLSLIVKSNTHLASKEENKDNESKTEKKSYDKKRSLSKLGSKSHDKIVQPESRRGSMLSRLKSKWSGKSSKKAKINEKPSIQEDEDENETENETEKSQSESESENTNKKDQPKNHKKSQNDKEEMKKDDHNNGKRSHDYNDAGKASILRKSDHREDNRNEDKHERMSRKSSVRDKELSRKSSQGHREDIDKDQHEGNRSTKSSRARHHEVENDDNSHSLKSHPWKQPLGYDYSKKGENGHFCKSDCGGKCSKAGQCVRIQDCFKKFEEKSLKKNKAILKKFNITNCAEYCALGYSQILTPQRIVPHSSQSLGQSSINGSGERLRDYKQSKKCCKSAKTDREGRERRSRPKSSQDSFNQDHAERKRSIRISKHKLQQSTTEEELERNRDLRRSRRSSAASKRERGSVRKSSQEKFYQYPEEKKRTSKVSRRRSDQSIPDEELYNDYDLRRSKRSSIVSIASTISTASNRDRGSIPRRSKQKHDPERNRINERGINQRTLEEDLRKFQAIRMRKRNSTASKSSVRSQEKYDQDRAERRRSSKVSNRGSDQSIFDEEYGNHQDLEKRKRSSILGRSSARSRDRYDRDRVGSRRSSKASKRGSDQSNFDDEYGYHQDLEKIKRSSIVGKRSARSQERYDRDRVGSRRNSKARKHGSDQSISEDEYGKHQDLEKRKRSSIVGKSSARSHERYDRDRVGSRRNSKARKHGSDQSISEDEYGKHQDLEKRKRSSSASKRERSSTRKSSQDKIDRNRKDSKRSSKLSKRGSIKSSTSSKSKGSTFSQESDRISIGREIREISSQHAYYPDQEDDRGSKSSAGTIIGDQERSSIISFNPIEELKPNSPVGSASDKTPAQFPFSARPMTTNIERDNTNRSCKKNGICQRRVCIGNCTKTVKIIECPYKNKEQTEERIVCYSPENRQSKSPRSQSKDRTSDSVCYCVKSQPAHHELLRTYSHHSMLEVPLVYPRARVIPKYERNNCKEVCFNNRKYFEDLSRQTNNDKANRLKQTETQAPTTSKKQPNLAEDLSEYKDPMEDKVHTDC